MSAPPNLTAAQTELLVLLCEEAAEVIQAATKVLRHGYDSRGYTNRVDLNREIAHFLVAVALLDADDELLPDLRKIDQAEKIHQLRSYLHHQENLK